MPDLVQHTPNPDRTRAQTNADVNGHIDHETGLRLQRAASRNPEDLTDAIVAVGSEWDFDRIVEAEGSLTGMVGLALAVLVDKRFLVIPGVAAAMLLLHATQGWYPLLPLLRRLGVRTQNEIDREYYALKMLRGDFEALSSAENNRRAIAAWNAVIA